MLTGSNVGIQAASLQGGSTALVLPFADDFDDGDSSGWLIANDTPKDDAWSVVSGEFVQSALVESLNSYEESYHLGTYAWLPSGLSLTDYRIDVEVRRIDLSRRESIGVLFRYQDPDNYYRLSINARYGFIRLEKRESGVFFTLARSALGFDPAATYTISVETNGSEIRTSIGGAVQLVANDTSLNRGSVGLFSQSAVAFDDVSITPADTTSDVRVAQPADLAIVSGNSVTVEAVARNVPAGGSVELSMPGQSPVLLTAPPWRATFSGISAGETTVRARMLNSSNNQIDQDQVSIAADGMYLLAIGDSITNGFVDTFVSDNLDAQRVSSNRGYAATLAALLEAMPPTEVVVFNEGIGGDSADENDVLRLESILERHLTTTASLVLFGTNDSLAGITSAAYETSMQSIVDRLNAIGSTPYVATVPPILSGSNPLASARNSRVRQYNDVIRNGLSGAQPGADLWAFFAPDDTGDGVADRIRSDLFADNLHPNALGHSIIATLWFNTLLGDSLGTSISPFIADRINQPAYKQNLLEAGDEYLIDSAATVEQIPGTLQDANWIMTAQGDAVSTANTFLSFELDRAADVYVAYDADAVLLPAWLAPGSSDFVDTGLTMRTSVTNYRVFRRSADAGVVSMGGNLAAGGGDASDMFLVAIRER
jgi:lysophospholipase L1-like esterase